jgi:hypothetical protein
MTTTAPASGVTISLDATDAMELAELCDYLIEWLATAPAAVGDDLARFGAHNGAPIEICRTLARFSNLLQAAPISGNPTGGNPHNDNADGGQL